MQYRTWYRFSGNAELFSMHVIAAPCIEVSLLSKIYETANFCRALLSKTLKYLLNYVAMDTFDLHVCIVVLL